MSDAPADNPQPGPEEIREQLRRILGSNVFATREKPSEVLEFVVEEHLQGRVLTEEDIRIKVFPDPPYEPEGTNTRNAVSTVRMLVEEYYANLGMNDAVRMTLPKKFSKSAPRKKKGDSYPVVCIYNPGRKEVAIYRLAQAAKRRGTPFNVRKAVSAFEMVLAENDKHWEAGIAKLECLLLMAIYAPGGMSKKQVLMTAREWAMSTAAEDRHDWRFCAFRGFILLFEHRRYHAMQMFLTAFEWNDEAVRDSLWGPAMGLLTGMESGPGQYTSIIAPKRTSDLNAWAALGFTQYFERDFEAAEHTFMLAINMERQFWLANIGLTLVALAQNDNEGAFLFYQRAHELLFEKAPFQPGIGFLSFLRSHPGDANLPPYLFDSVMALLNPASQDHDWLQLALIRLDVDKASAVQALILAWQNFDPLVLLVPIWPIFDPLRDDPQFEALMLEIGGRAAKDENPGRP